MLNNVKSFLRSQQWQVVCHFGLSRQPRYGVVAIQLTYKKRSRVCVRKGFKLIFK